MTTPALLTPTRPTTLTLLHRVVLGAARADVVFDHISQDFFNLRLTVAGVNTNANAALAHVKVQFNGDTTSGNYKWQEITHPGAGAVIGIEATADASAYLGFQGTAADPLVMGNASGVLYDYRSTVFQKLLIADEYARTPSNGFSTAVKFGSWWTGIVPVHTVRFFPEAGSFAANTVISIWGEP